MKSENLTDATVGGLQAGEILPAERESESTFDLIEVDQDGAIRSRVCDTCAAHCCSQKFGYQAINLTCEERENPLFKPHLTDFGCLKLEGRYCRFLDASSFRCTIYDQRPQACRRFVCFDTEGQDPTILAMVYRSRGLRAHLESHGALPPLTEDLFWSENERRVPTPAYTHSAIERINYFPPGTRRFFKLCAETGEIVLEGRRRSTRKHPTTDPLPKVIHEAVICSDDDKARP